MPTTSLPIDILHLLLLEISDLDSLYSLILTYKCFYFVFIHTKSAILSVVLENEILQHRHDAYFLARYHDDLLYSAIPSEANFYEIIGKYVSLRGGNENTPDLVLPSVDDHGLRDKTKNLRLVKGVKVGVRRRIANTSLRHHPKSKEQYPHCITSEF